MTMGTDGLSSEKCLKIHQKTSYSLKSNELITTDKFAAYAKIYSYVTIVTTRL